MRAGKLRNIVELQEKVVTRGAYGQENVTWATKITVRASINYLSGKEGFTSEQFWGKNIVQFTLRYTDLSVIDRILYDGRIFDIVPPVKVPNDVKSMMHIIAQERAK